ncbi:hypothetical protein RB12104 [Rhodopirellula baltica SH 1]|uniref:Uncharacterized protein n=1 Tax=Rhodopirellula baltica (strain DSM 10527 / NCIMB 13988 / SH1) TaxID=243090 RepID=Q7UJ63_RHOBA|nr:hypothetical protein RB12104 [Rhodopirellula baltica SH 1]
MVLGRWRLLSRMCLDDASLCSKASARSPCGTWPTGIVNRILANPATSRGGCCRPGCTWRWCLAGEYCSRESDLVTPRFVPKHRRRCHVEHGLRDREPNSGESGCGDYPNDLETFGYEAFSIQRTRLRTMTPVAPASR